MSFARARAAAAALFAVSLSVPAALSAQAPDAGVDKGYLDFIGSYSGAPKVSNSNSSVTTGPYRAKFGATSTLASQATEFDVFCIDWLSDAGDGSVSTRQPWNVRILTFEEAVTAQTPVAIALRAKFAAANGGTTGGLTVGKLNATASIADLMTQSNKPQWNEMHVAMWNVLWKKGTMGSFGLPGVVNGSNNTPWRVNDPGDDPNSAKYYADNASMNFDGSSFRIFVPVKETKTTTKTCTAWDRYSRCTSYSYSYTYTETFDASRQVLMGEVVVPQGGIDTVVPEPSTYALMGAGLLALGVVARRRRTV